MNAMNTTEDSNPPQSGKASTPRWAVPIILMVLFLLVHVIAPWGLSLLSARHGWLDGNPGTWNLRALILVAAGTSGIVWCLSLHFVQSPQAVLMERIPTYLLARGPYRYT